MSGRLSLSVRSATLQLPINFRRALREAGLTDETGHFFRAKK